MADADALQTRKAHHNQDDKGAATAVPMVESHSGTDQYPNPFQQQQQHHVGHGHSHHQRQQHYNVMIPTVDHWPAIFMSGVKTTAHYIVLSLQQVHNKFQEYQASRSSSYQVLPTTNIDTRPYPQQNSTRQPFRFGSKRQQKSGHQVTCSGRQITRSFFLLILLVTTIVLLVIPHRLNPLEDRAIWIRYYNHEEAVKITVPYGLKLHVSDVKKTALKELQFGFSNFKPGNVKLITMYGGALAPDQIWKNSRDEFKSTARYPILVVDTKYELFRFLDSALGCFATANEYSQDGRDLYSVSFSPDYRGYSVLAKILNAIANGDTLFQEWDIFYLREAFNDPKKTEPRTGRMWRSGQFNRDLYIAPNQSYIPHRTAIPVWEPYETQDSRDLNIIPDLPQLLTTKNTAMVLKEKPQDDSTSINSCEFDPVGPQTTTRMDLAVFGCY
ncbi:hypothetical protein BGZ95_000466 [Linnemannia exigua]|uniref:Uncharacterized protein n=1 Tax=Linnemannia exigua TaxID=604196 RepID=A0AAD4D876_9FUNG|nr:hypothetical protein BGZ95_000466 [Linnemannia exigua]